VQKLREAVVKAFEDPQLRDTWFKLGAEAGGSTPEEFRDLVRHDVAKWARVVKEAGVKPE
jgi:tripartite-type tricarboxylate transporter receptor subunit TctC